MADIDVKIRVDFFTKRAEKLQNALLQMEIDIKSAQEQLDGLKNLKKMTEDSLVSIRSEIVRAKAEMEEGKNGRSGKA
jgi:chromosome segregation ATPase